MSDAGSDRIGPTAHYTAYVWHRLGLPYAELFSTRTGAALYWSFFAAGEWMTRLSDRVPSMRDYLEYRHRLIDAVVQSADPDRIVELGAGLSRRGITWAVQRDIDVYELDLPAMIAAKRRALRAAPDRVRGVAQRRLHLREVDVLDDAFGTELEAMCRGAARPVVIAEGLLSYFDPPDRARVVAGVAAGLSAAPGGVFLCDLHTKAAQAQVGRAASVLRFAIRAITRRRRAIDPYASAEALERAFVDAGFDAIEIAEAEDHVAAVPELGRVRSPAHIVVATRRNTAA